MLNRTIPNRISESEPSRLFLQKMGTKIVVDRKPQGAFASNGGVISQHFFQEILDLQHSSHITLGHSTRFNISFPVKDKISVKLDFGEISFWWTKCR